MVTIRQRAIAQQIQRIESRPLSRTERKRIEIMKRRPPTPKVTAPTTITQPAPDVAEQRTAWENEIVYRKGGVVFTRKDMQGIYSYARAFAQGKPYVGTLQMRKDKQNWDKLREADPKFDWQMKKANRSRIAVQQWESQKEVFEERIMAGFGERVGGQLFVTLAPEKFAPTIPKEGEEGFIGRAGEWIDPATGVGYSGEKQSPFHVPASSVKVTRIGDIPIVTYIKPPTVTPAFPSEARPTITRTDIGGDVSVDVITQPTISKEVVEVWKAPSGEEIPITKTYYIDPTKRGLWEKRIATPEEEKYFKEQTSVLIASEEKLTKEGIEWMKLGKTIEDVQDISKTLNLQVKAITTDPLFKIPMMKELVEPDYEKIKDPIGKAYVGFVSEIFKDIKEKPLKQFALYGAGVGVRVIVKGAGAGITALGSRVSAKAGVMTAKTLQYALAGTGVYFGGKYAITTAERIHRAETPQEKGGILGLALKDISLLGFGYAKGGKLYESLVGKWATRKIPGVDIGKLTQKAVATGKKEFPTAEKEKHLELFKKEKGGYHTTSENFWKMDKKIIAQSGKAELEGLYISPYISPHFLKLSKTGKYKTFGLETFGKKPGIAYLQPKGFDVGKYVWKKSPAFPGQQAHRGKYAHWVSPGEPGVADVPTLKTEIEAIIRPGEKYVFESRTKYVTIEGVRVPIDTFVYAGKKVPAPKGDLKSIIKNILKGKEYDPSSYSLTGKTPSVTPTLVSVSSILSRIDKSTSSTLSKIEKNTSSILSKSSKITSSSLKKQVKSRVVSEKSIMRNANRVVSSALSYRIPGITDVPYSYVRERKRKPTTPPGVPPFPKLSQKDLKKKLRKLLFPEYFYAPGFAGKISQKVIEVSERQAMKILKQVQTGFEIRPSIILKKEIKKKRKKKK